MLVNAGRTVQGGVFKRDRTNGVIIDSNKVVAIPRSKIN